MIMARSDWLFDKVNIRTSDFADVKPKQFGSRIYQRAYPCNRAAAPHLKRSGTRRRAEARSPACRKRQGEGTPEFFKTIKCGTARRNHAMLCRTVHDPRGNVTEATYDLDRRKLLTLAHNGGAAAALLAETRTTYDPVGRVTKEGAAKGFDTANPWLSTGTPVATWIATRTITYTPTSKPATVKDADNRTTTTDYDNLDRVSTVTDPVSRQTHFVYCTAADADCSANAVRKEQRAYNTNFQQDYAVYTYTLNGKQASVKDADGGSHTTTRAYDSFDRLISTIFPGGTHEDLIYYSGGTLCSANGSPCQRITRAGDTITYTYDRLDRMTSKVVPSENLIWRDFGCSGDAIRRVQGAKRWRLPLRRRVNGAHPCRSRSSMRRFSEAIGDS